MKAILQGGPYDGTSMDHNDVNLYTSVAPVGIRKFIFMPAPENWGAVRKGDMAVSDSFEGRGAIYELVRTQDGMVGQFDQGGVFNEASKALSEGRQIVPDVPFTGQYFKCFRGGLNADSLPPNYFDMKDEKDRNWKCTAISRAQGESAELGEVQTVAPWTMMNIHCNDISELPARLADQID